MGGLQQRLRRNAAAQQAGATEPRILFDDRRPEAELRAAHSSDISAGATPPLPAALASLCERFSYRLPSDPSGMKVLDREAKKALQSEVVMGRIKGFALVITPTGAGLQDLGLEVVVSLLPAPCARRGLTLLRTSTTRGACGLSN